MRDLRPLLLALSATVALGHPLNKRDPGCVPRGLAKTGCFIQRAVGFLPLGIPLDPGYCGDIADAWFNCPSPKPGPSYSLTPGPGQTIQISAAGAPTVQQGGTNGAGTVVVPTNGEKPATGRTPGTALPALGSPDAAAPDGEDSSSQDQRNRDNSSGGTSSGENSQSSTTNSQQVAANYQPATANYEQLTDQLNPDGTPKKKEGFDWENFLASMSSAIQSQQGARSGYPADYDLASSGYGYGSGYNSPGVNYGASTETPGTPPPPAAAPAGIGRGSGIVFGTSNQRPA